MKTYRLDANGFLIEENRLFAVMRNNLRDQGSGSDV